MAATRKNAGNSSAEDRFIEIFCDTFGACCDGLWLSGQVGC